MPEKWFVIINPVSGARSGLRVWKHVKPLLEGRQLGFVSRTTEYHKHSTELVRTAIEEGYRNFICVGGDGTFHNMVNGLMTQDKVPTTEVSFLVLSVGTGNDWIRSHHVPSKYKKAIHLIESGVPFVQDIGKVSYFENGQEQYRYFHNIAGVGFDAFVVERTQEAKLAGQWSYLLGLIQSVLRYQSESLKVTFNDQEVIDRMYVVIAGIGRYGGGGMRLTPEAITNDGLLDMTIIKNMNVAEIIFNIVRLYNGKILRYKKVRSARLKNIRIEPNGSMERVYLEADGELVGRGPFEMTIIPKALKVIVPRGHPDL